MEIGQEAPRRSQGVGYVEGLPHPTLGQWIRIILLLLASLIVGHRALDRATDIIFGKRPAT